MSKNKGATRMHLMTGPTACVTRLQQMEAHRDKERDNTRRSHSLGLPSELRIPHEPPRRRITNRISL